MISPKNQLCHHEGLIRTQESLIKHQIQTAAFGQIRWEDYLRTTSGRDRSRQEGVGDSLGLSVSKDRARKALMPVWLTSSDFGTKLDCPQSGLTSGPQRRESLKGENDGEAGMG